ncbi:MAG: flagellin [Phycisphaerales bacterium]|nr:MAG: flagellin [Phycisphaerales bacterium]
MSTINTNIPSLVAARILNNNNDRLGLSLERLSTGYRINTGKDDPAGLIASEVMRSEQIAILAAIDNSLAADKIVAVAEGALNEVNALLLELEALVDKSTNSAALSDDEVRANQLQMDSILDSIDRIANNTSFKGKKMLNGTMGYVTQGVGTEIAGMNVTRARLAEGQQRTVTIQVASAAETGQLFYSSGAATIANSVTIRVSGEFGADTVSVLSGATLQSLATAVNQTRELTGVSATVTGAGASSQLVFSSTAYGSDAFVTVEAINGTFDTTNPEGTTIGTDYGLDVTATINGLAANTEGLEASIRTSTLSLDVILSESFGTLAGSDTTSFTITGGGANFSLSPTVGVAGMESIGIKDVSSASLGNGSVGFLSSLRSGAANDLNSGNLATAQRIVRQASKDVSTLRGRLGAFQKDTLQPNISSLQITYENTQAAESAIRDTDFAYQTSELTRAQILVQASTATLQIANAAPAAVLSLLG